MSLAWISLTPRLSQGIEQINSINNKKFPLFLEHIAEAIEENREPFSNEELQKLGVTFNKTQEELRLILETINYMILKSDRYLMKPTTLQSELVEKLKFNSDVANCFTQLWTKNVKNTLDNLDNLQKVDKLSWELNLEIASDSHSKIAIPTSLLQLSVKNKQNQEKNILVEMKEEELVRIYSEIETIQTCLDNIKR